MNNEVKRLFKNISIVSVALIIIVSILTANFSNAQLLDNQTVGELIRYSKDKDSWYNFDASNELGAKITSGTDAPVDEVGGMCIHPNNHYFYGTTYKVVNIFDINNNTSGNSVKIYSENDKKGTEYSFSNENVKPILMIGYLAQKSVANGETVAITNGNYKEALTRMFWETSYVNQMKKLGLSDDIEEQGNGYTDYNEFITEAAKEASIMQDQGSLDKATLEISMTQDEIEKIAVSTVDGKTFIGPYRVNLEGGAEIGEITINGTEKVTQIAGSLNKDSIESVDKVEHHKPFYIVLDKNIDTIDTIKIKAKEALTSIKARIVVISGGASQNFIIYNAEETKAPVEKTLPTPKSAKMEIIKVDEFQDSSIKLKGIEFKIFSYSQGWLSNEGDTIKYENTIETAKPFVTDDNGKISVNNIVPGKYFVFETGLPEELKGIYSLGKTTSLPFIKKDGEMSFIEGEFDAKSVFVKNEDGELTSKINVKSGQTVSVTAVNKRATTDVIIEKVDKDSEKPLDGIEFRIYSLDVRSAGWVTADSSNRATGVTKDYNDKNIAKLVTQNDGKTPKLTELPVGRYAVYETGLGKHADIYELGKFKIDGDSVEHDGHLIDVKDVKAETTGSFIFKETNPKVFIKLSGYVWEDTLNGKGPTRRDGVFSKLDNLIEGIEVTLIDTKTGEERTTKTDANGKYEFKNVRVRDISKDGNDANYLSNYVVRFKYDGIIYQDIVTSKKDLVKYTDAKTIAPNTSKAIEDSEIRDALNNDFKEVGGEGTKLPSGKTLEYTKKDGVVGLKNIMNRSVVRETTGSEAGQVTLSGDTIFGMEANTDRELLKEYYDNLSKEKEVTELTDINLGLYRREMADLTLRKDTYKADISMNGFTYTYMYNQAFEDPTDTTMAVKFDGKYNLPIYKADVKADEIGKPLSAKIMYKIELTNSSDSLYSEVKRINEYFSSDYELANVYVSEKNMLDDTAKPVSAKATAKKDAESGYEKYVIELAEPIKIPAKSTKDYVRYLFIEFNIKDIRKYFEHYVESSDVKDADGHKISSSDLENYAEIETYSLYSDEGYSKSYAGIDVTSIPNNLEIKTYSKDTREDDEFRAPGLRVIDAGQRSISGTVFEDQDADGKTGMGEERIGNGILDDGETRIEGVTVQLYDANGNKAKVWDGTKLDDAKEITTDGKGNFTIEGLTPGQYTITYTWGEKQGGYNVRDYKGTIYVNKERANDPNWIRTEDPRYSDAMDNMTLREELDGKALSGEPDGKENMNSVTPKFNIGIEKDLYEEVLVGDKKVYHYDVKNVDFGIIERPKQSMSINKDLQSVYITMADGRPFVDAKIENGKLNVTTGEKYVSGGSDLGYIWVQISKEITESMTAKLGYSITVANNSEKDYDDDNHNYYLYGDTNGAKENTMALRASEVYDYAKGSLLSTDDKVNTVWETVKPGDYKIDTKTGNTLSEQYFEENVFKDENGAVTGGKWQYSSVESAEIYTDWVEQMETTSAKTVRDVKLTNREIMKYIGNELTKALKPGQTATAQIQTSKLVANGDEIRFDNDAEIANIEFKTDQKIGRVPTAYTSKVYDRGEWASITPETGENRDYTVIIITAVSAIAVLGVGVLFIKKKILK